MIKLKKSKKAIIPKRKMISQRKSSKKRSIASSSQESQYTRSLIEASLDPLVTISAGGKILDVNEASILITGVSRHKLIGTNFSNYFTDPDHAQKGYLQAFKKGFVADYALTIKHKNGNLTEVLYNASVYKDDKGNVLGVFAAARDVTEQKQSSRYARSLLEASLDPLVTISATGKILDVNEASIKATGIRRQKLIGTNFSTYFTEPDKAQEGYLQAFEKGFVADYALTIKHKNGNLTDVLYNASVYKDDKGNVLGVFAAARDVTEQKWAKDLRIANIELAFQNNEKEKRAVELGIANVELAFQNEEKEKRAAELSVANKELHFQNNEKENRAAELIVANIELSFQNEEKEKRAAELGIANVELAFQSEEKEKRAAELSVANQKLAFQNEEKEKRAAELSVANKELHFQNNEKENRAAELIVANKELSFQNEEKEKRAAELGIANVELAFQSEEKEKRAIELISANKELQSFAYVSSHDLQEPLRKIQMFTNRIIDKESAALSETGKEYFQRIQGAAKRMQTLIEDLLAFSRVNTGVKNFEMTNLTTLLDELINDFMETIEQRQAKVEIGDLGTAYIIPFQFRQLMQNLIGNALKFSKSGTPPCIKISNKISKGNRLTKENVWLLPGKLYPEKNYNHIKISDNGIGFEPRFQEQVFEIFQRLHGKEEYAGTGIGLAIVKKIVENHNGVITATSELGQGATFDIYIPEQGN